MRGKLIHHLYLTEEEEHVLINFFNTFTNMVGKDTKLDMMELLEMISLGYENYGKYDQEIQIHYND